MASASGPPKDQEPVQRRGQRERQESTSSSSAAAAQGGAAASRRGRAPRPPSQGRPPTPPRRSTVESLTQGRAHEQPGGGGRGTGGSSSAAAAVDQKGKRKIGEGSSSPPPDNREQAQRKSEPPKEKLLGSSMRALRSHAKKLSDSPISPELSDPDAEDAVKDIELVMARKLHWDDPSVRKEELEVVVEEEEGEGEEEEELLTPVSRRKKPLRSRILGYISNVFLCRKGSPTEFSDLNDEKELPPLVHHQKISLADVPDHYCLPPGLRGIISSNFLILFSKYSEFRPVHGDGECFYRSFIISYLEQVLDREDTDEEQRLLAAVEVEVKPMAMQIDYPEMATAFSWSHEVFKKLIENVIRWKSIQNGVASTDSRKQELLNFFSSKSTSNGIFIFLRSVAATWMCSHKDEYEPHVPALGDDYTLEFWCATHLLPLGEYTDHIPMRALAAALGVPLRVENLHNGPAHDIYTADGVNVPRVTLLYTGIHYDILYTCSSSGGR